MVTDFRVGDWIVRPQRGCIELRDGSVHLSPKAMAVLEQLAEAEGDVVSREDLLDAVWPRSDVTEDVLTHSVSDLRKAFGDSPQESRVIQTIPKKGFRLIPDVRSLDVRGEVSTTEAASHGTPKMGLRNVWLLVAVIAAGAMALMSLPDTVPPTGIAKSITVHPFADLSEEGDQEHLAFGIAEELAGRLSVFPDLAVYGPREWSLPEREVIAIESSAGTSYLLGGSIRRSGDELRINAVLTDVYDGKIEWQHRFERSFADVFDIEDEITDAVVHALSVRLEIGNGVEVTGGTSNPDAYEAVLRGDTFFHMDAANLAEALKWYTRATAVDPDYAIAWQRLALYYNHIWVIEGRAGRDESRALARDAISRALALAPRSRDVLAAAASTAFNDRDWFRARRFYDQAMGVEGGRRAGGVTPDINLSVHSDMLLKMGFVEDYLSLLERLDRVRPITGAYVNFLSQAYFANGRHEEALGTLEQAFPEARAVQHICYGAISVALSLRDEALIRLWLDRGLNECGIVQESYVGYMSELLNDRDAALDWLDHAYRVEPSGDYFVVLWAAYYGDDSLALRALDRSRDLWIFWIPSLAHLRETEEFKAIVQDMGLVDFWREYGWNDYCYPVGDDDFECR